MQLTDVKLSNLETVLYISVWNLRANMRQPASVIMPTVRWTEACDEVASQLGPDDELLIVHDEPSDPVATREEATPEGVRLIEAGQPEGCSGKANAVVTGMQQASHDLLVWSDDDFHHPPDWVDKMVSDYEENGPTSELPVFVGNDPLSWLLEPAFQVLGGLGVYVGKFLWGGAVAFHRDDIDEQRFYSELSQTVSDDVLLSEYLNPTAAPRRREIPAGENWKSTMNRAIRYNHIIYHHLRLQCIGSFLLMTLLTAACILFPILTVFITLGMCGLYAVLGIRRVSALFAVPAMAATIPLWGYAFLTDTMVWGGRRYAFRDKFDVEVLE